MNTVMGVGNTESPIWTCIGSVCGGCDVRHRSYAAAAACCDRHMAAVKRGHGRSAYSDRWPTPVNRAAELRHEADRNEYNDFKLGNWGSR